MFYVSSDLRREHIYHDVVVGLRKPTGALLKSITLTYEHEFAPDESLTTWVSSLQGMAPLGVMLGYLFSFLFVSMMFLPLCVP